jgi:hypothetical protein
VIRRTLTLKQTYLSTILVQLSALPPFLLQY